MAKKIKGKRSGKRKQKDTARSMKRHKVDNAVVEHKTRESFSRRASMKRKLQFNNLNRALEREEMRLRHYNEADEKTPEKKVWEYQLKGAARPAWMVYPELYPEKHAEIERQNARREHDLFEQVERVQGFAVNRETREFLSVQLQFGMLSRIDGTVSAAISAFQRCIELDDKDALGARIGLVAALIDMAELDSAIEQLVVEEAYWTQRDLPIPVELLYARVLVEFVSGMLMEQEDAEESAVEEQRTIMDKALKEAIKRNPYIANALVHHAEFEQVADPNTIDPIIDEIRSSVLLEFAKRDPDLDPSANAIEDYDVYRKVSLCSTESLEGFPMEEAVLYFAREISCWRDAEGAFEWVEETLKTMVEDGTVNLDIPKEDKYSKKLGNITLRRLYQRGVEE